ncbi:universal stress protein [Salinibacter grassmerensis]|uniref:universal stress protein n=1 Tax=Salinibacter grassmerensis TaxID=3040353 RepID=UPI0021E96F9C|nr:universal stress protein [Salinibacter grassmerensis]
MLHAAHILCLGSPTSAVGTQAAHLARRLGATLHIMSPPSSDPAATGATRATPASVKEAAIPKRIVETQPSSVAAVLQYACDQDIDLVVADTPRDRGPVPPFATDVSQALTRRLDCPVFVVERQGDPDAIQRLLVPTDLSDCALRAFRYAVALARLYDATIDALHVIESLPYVALTPTDRLSLGATTLSERRGRRRLRAFLQEGEAADVQVQPHITHGDAADQISRFADQADVDLMVLSAHGNDDEVGPFGPVGTRVLGRVACPLFLLRASGPSLLTPPDEVA